MHKKGSVLMISLWILAILVVFALGLGHRATINLRLARYQRDRLKATCLAKAGINRAIAELIKDKNDTSRQYDSLDEPWSTGKDLNNNDIFEDIEIVEKSGETFTVKVTDEESKININTASKESVLALLNERNIEDSDNLANTIIDWIDQDNAASTTTGETENEIFKNAPLKTPEEILLILEDFYKDNKKINDGYEAIKNLITVYAGDKININTASSDILTILAKSVAEGIDPSILITEIQKNTFANQEAIDNFTISNNPEMQQIYNNIKSFFTYQSNYFKITSEGKVGNIIKNITATYDREGKKIIYWHEN